MVDTEGVFVVSVPKDVADRAASALPATFSPSVTDDSGPEFRFGMAEVSEFVGIVKDVAELIAVVYGVATAMRAAGGGKVGVRSAAASEPIEVDADTDEATIAATLSAECSDKG